MNIYNKNILSTFHRYHFCCILVHMMRVMLNLVEVVAFKMTQLMSVKNGRVFFLEVSCSAAFPRRSPKSNQQTNYTTK